MSTHIHVQQWAVNRPDAPCIIEAETGREITYRQFFAAVQHMRRALGEAPRCVLMALSGGIVDAVLWLAALTGGHTLVPLSPDASSDERARAISMYSPDMLIVERQEDQQNFLHGDEQVTILTHEQCNALVEEAITTTRFPILPFQEGSVCLMTSGTTGEPKGVVLQEHHIAWTADHIRISHQLTQNDKGLTPLPFFHVNAPVVSLCASLMAGSTVVIARKFSRTHFWEQIERYRITWASIVPAIVEILLTTNRPAFLPGDVRFFRTGSSSLPAATLEAFEEKFGIPLIETYGLSETASEAVGNPLPPRKHKPGSAGLPVSVSVRICSPRVGDKDEELQDVPQGKTGEICISGPGVISAYYGDADPESFQNGWFRTGDLGYMDEEGYLYVTGRSREVIIRGGENIAPREVEEVLQSHPAVRESAVVGRPDPIYGEQVVAFVVPQNTWNDEMNRSLHDFATQRLSPQKAPVEFLVVDTLPRNATGKVQRHVLRERVIQAMQRENAETTKKGKS